MATPRQTMCRSWSAIFQWEPGSSCQSHALPRTVPAQRAGTACDWASACAGRPAHTGHQAQTRIEPRDIAHVTPRYFRYGRKVPTYRIGEFARAARHPEAAASADRRVSTQFAERG